MRATQDAWKLLTLGLLLTSSAGCVQMGRPWASKSGTPTDVQQAAFEEEVPDAPGDPKNPNQLKLAYARWMEDSGNIGEARDHYVAVRTAEPKNVDAILGLARVDLISGRTTEAEQGFQRAVKLNPHSAAAHFELARCYEAQERWTDTVHELNTALLAEPANATYRFQLAVALTKAGDVDGALPHFVRVVGDAEAHYNVGLILKDQGHIPEAQKHLSVALAKKPELKQAEHWLRELRTTSPTSQVPEHSLTEARMHDPGIIQAAAPTMFSPSQVEQHQNQRPQHL